MRFLLFGASGYIGRHLRDAVVAAGHELRFHGSVDGTIPPGSEISVEGSLDRVNWDCDGVFMFAGVTGTAASFDQFEAVVRGNELSLLRVLDSIRRSPHRPRVIFPSSRLVYQGSSQALTESAPLEARTVYAASKIACEFLLHSYAHAFDIPHSIVRICVPYGSAAGAGYSFGTIGNLLRQARSGCIRLYGDGSVRRSFTHIADLCRLTIALAVHPAAQNATFNIPGEDFSLSEAAQLIAASLASPIEYVPWPATDWRLESGSTVFDSRKIEQLLGFGLTRRLLDWANDASGAGA